MPRRRRAHQRSTKLCDHSSWSALHSLGLDSAMRPMSVAYAEPKVFDGVQHIVSARLKWPWGSDIMLRFLVNFN